VKEKALFSEIPSAWSPCGSHGNPCRRRN